MGNALVSVHRFTPSGFNLTGAVNFYPDNGAPNTYTITTSPAMTVIPLGATFSFQAARANTGTSTLNVDGIGGITIKKNGGTGASVGSNLAPGDIAAGQIVNVAFDGVNFQLQSTLGNSTSSGSGANTALSNLGSVAINSDLLPNAPAAVNVGSASLPFNTVYAQQFRVPGSSTAEIIGNEGSCSTSPVGVGTDVVCVGDSTSHTVQASYNGSSFYSLPQRIASGTVTLSATAIASGACSATVTVSAPGLLTTDRIETTFANTPATADGLLNLVNWLSSGNVNFEQCNPTAGSLTPGGLNLNWAVVR